MSSFPELSFTLLKRFGFQLLDSKPSQWVIERRNHRFALHDLPLPGPVLDLHTWRRFTWALWAARLVVDRLDSRYQVACELDPPDRVRNIYEVPSPYGNRIRLLLPTLVSNAFTQLTQLPLLLSDWVNPAFVVAFSIEEGLGTHLLTQSDMPSYPLTPDLLETRARLAHFYSAYKKQPAYSLSFPSVGKLTLYGSVEGQIGSRAILLPDYDWEAAQDYGCFIVPSRDTLLIAEPYGRLAAETLYALAVNLVRHLYTLVFPASCPDWTDICAAHASRIQSLLPDASFLRLLYQVPYSATPYLMTPTEVLPFVPTDYPESPLHLTLLDP